MSKVMEKKNTVKEKEVYTIRLLENSEFDKLPYQGIDDSLGFADPSTGDCFIRKTGVPEWDMATIQHEIDELLSKESFDTDSEGIRHKKFFKQVAAPILATLAGSMIGAPYLGALGAPLGAAAGSAIQQKVQTGRIDPLQTGLAGLSGAMMGPGIKAGYASVPKAGLGKIGAGVKGAIFGAPKITKAPLQGPVTAAQSALGYTSLAQVPPGILGSRAATAALAAKPLIGPATQAQAARGFTSLAQVPRAGVTTVGAPPVTPPVGLPAAPGITPTGVAPTPGVAPPAPPVAPVAPAPTGLGAIAKRLLTPEGILGAGALAAGAAPGAPEFEMPPRIAELEQAFMTQRGLSEVGQVARGQLLETMKARPEDLFAPADDAFIQASLRGTRESYERGQEALDARYNQAGVYGSGEHLAAKDKLDEELRQLESDFIALENDRRFTMAQTAKQNAVVQALADAGLTEKHIMDIASMDVWAAAQQFGAEVKDMQVIKEALAGIGSELLGGAFKKPEEVEIEGQ